MSLYSSWGCLLRAWGLSRRLGRLLHEPYRVDESVTTVITGDSHVQIAINDGSMGETRNIALFSEPYIYSYYKLKEILEHNHNIEKVILGFGYHNMSSYYDDYIVGWRAVNILPKYIDVLEYPALIELVTQRPGLLMPVVRALISMTHDEYPYVGGFSDFGLGHLQFDEQAMRRRIQRQFRIGNSTREMSELNMAYLHRIVALCESHDVELTLMRTPLHEKYQNHIPTEYLDGYKRLVTMYGLAVIDFRGIDLADEHFLPDGDHVNAGGSVLTTEHFMGLWNN